MREKRRVAQHGVKEQPLVAVCGRFDECIFVAESHGDLRKVRRQSRRLDSELKAYAIIWLNAERYHIRLRFADAETLFEKLSRRRLKDDAGFGKSLCQPLPRPQIKGNSGPA